MDNSDLILAKINELAAKVEANGNAGLTTKEFEFWNYQGALSSIENGGIYNLINNIGMDFTTYDYIKYLERLGFSEIANKILMVIGAVFATKIPSTDTDISMEDLFDEKYEEEINALSSKIEELIYANSQVIWEKMLEDLNN